MNKPSKQQINIVESAFAAYHRAIPGCSFAQMGRECNEDLGRADKPQRWNDWRNGHRPIPEPVMRWLMDWALTEALTSRRSRIEDIARMAKELSPPLR